MIKTKWCLQSEAFNYNTFETNKNTRIHPSKLQMDTRIHKPIHKKTHRATNTALFSISFEINVVFYLYVLKGIGVAKSIVETPTSVPQKEKPLKCPRCDSTNTKFCYYNNYSLTQPRHFCKSCRRYWTLNGSLRNVRVGGGSRKPKRPFQDL